MATDFELALFERQLKEAHTLPEASRWNLERDASVPLGVTAVMHPRLACSELFKARLRWTDLFKPPSLKFIDIATGADNRSAAWPQCFGFRPSSLDACLPWTAEGHGLHPEWTAAGMYPRVEAPVQFALLSLQFALDNSYLGRGS